MQRTQVNIYPIEQFATSKKSSMPTLMQEITPVVLVKFEIEYREKLNFNDFHWNFRTIRILTQGSTTMIF